MYYYLAMEHKNEETFCPFFDWTKVSCWWQNAEELAKMEHQHWLIWWSTKNRFTGSGFYKYISKYREDFKLENYSGPPFITFNIPNWFCHKNLLKHWRKKDLELELSTPKLTTKTSYRTTTRISWNSKMLMIHTLKMHVFSK